MIKNRQSIQLEFSSEIETALIYYLLLRPDEPFFSEVLGMKKQADTILGIDYNCHFLPHITLLQFPILESKEEFLVNLLNDIVQKRNVTLLLKSSGFQIFSDKHLVIPIDSENNIQRFISGIEIQLFISRIISGRKKDYFKATQPHITIVKNSNLKDIELVKKKLQVNFANLEFSCKNLVLLKSITGQAPWTPVSSFSLEN